jgi:hypothetical protein
MYLHSARPPSYSSCHRVRSHQGHRLHRGHSTVWKGRWQNCVVVIKELPQEVERRVSDSLLHFLLFDIGSYQLSYLLMQYELYYLPGHGAKNEVDPSYTTRLTRAIEAQ